LKAYLRHAHLNIGDIEKINVGNQLLNRPRDYDNPVLEFLDFMSKPENFWFTCKYLLNVDLLPFQLCILQELWERKFPMLIATRGAGKTWILALYSLLRAFFHQGCKIIVIGAALDSLSFCLNTWKHFIKILLYSQIWLELGKGKDQKETLTDVLFMLAKAK
jgi:hypothetical protein